jgi:uncharacterized membrane protein YccC
VSGLTAFAAGRQLVAEALSALGQEMAELDRPGKRARLCLMASLSVAISVTAALALRLDNPWWAGISGFVSVQATRPGSITRGILRVTGTTVGASVGLATAPWLVYDHLACCIALCLFTTAGILGFMLSRYGYAWLFAGITAVMVLIMSLDDPAVALTVAFYRTAEVVVGTVAALVVASLLASNESLTAPPMPSGWTDFLGGRWPVVLHALRSGIAVALLPPIWNWLQLPSLSQVAVTVTAVVAIPSLAADPLSGGRLVATRGLHRLLGCFFGGLAGLAMLALSLGEFLPWLAALTAGVWIGTHVQASERGVGYAGIQGTVAFIMTLVQRAAPPQSIMPGTDRFAGIMCGITVLLVISLLLWPSADAPGARHTGASIAPAGH